MEGMVHLYYAGVFGGPQNDARLLRGQDSWGIGLNLLDPFGLGFPANASCQFKATPWISSGFKDVWHFYPCRFRAPTLICANTFQMPSL